MAVATPAVAIAFRTFVAALATPFFVMGTAGAEDQPDRCQPPLPAMRSGKGQDFAANAYGHAVWHVRSAAGRRLPYAVHVWKGRVGGEPAYLTFDEIPGTSGPNYHLGTALKRIRGKIDWRASRTFVFDPRFVVYSGPLAGEWTVMNCKIR